MESIENRFRQLPPDLQKEVIDFIEFLLARKVLKEQKKPQLQWISGLKDFSEEFTALELQKKALEWRG
ncbi:MAG: DUF2281 domain-containing protein [Vulcanimicrobiota bacterium]